MERTAFEVIGAILTILLTGVFIVRLLERRDRTVLRMGGDSAAVFLLFAGGVAILAGVGSEIVDERAIVGS